MSVEVLKYINKELNNLGINYEFMEFSSPVRYPYFVGEYNDSNISIEDGYGETTFTLTGFTRNDYLELEIIKEKIAKLFYDKTTILENKCGLVVSYDGSLIIPTGDIELKKIQINLRIKEWKVDLDV